jgi:hypothetical protein
MAGDKRMNLQVRWRSIAVAVTATLGLGVVLEVISPEISAFDWLLLKLAHPGPRHLQLHASLAVGGQAIQISRSVDCKPTYNRGEEAWFDRSPGWYPDRYVVSEALPDGSGVMIVVPRACNRDKLPRNDFVPLVLWTDSSTKPHVVEAYVDRHGLIDGQFRVRLTSFGLTRLEGASSSPTPTTDFADWINLYSKDPSPPGDITHLVMLGAVKISQSDLPADIQSEASSLNGQFVALAPQAGSAATVVEAVNNAASGEYDDAQNLDITTRLIPLRPLKDPGSYEVLSNETGIAYFVAESDSRCDQSAAYCVQWRGKDLLLDHRPSHYLAVDDELLYQFRFGATLVRRP